MTTAFTNGRILTDKGFETGKAVLVEKGMIAAILPAADPSVAKAAKTIDLAGQMLLPGFIDVQVNGGGGVLFNDSPSVETIRAIGAAHRRYGTTGFLPTLITDHLATVDLAMRAAEQAVDQVPGVLGVHVEGPFLNRDRKGVHDASKFRLLDEPATKLLGSLKKGRTLATLAPEMTSAALIAQLRDSGVIIAAGHTNGTYDQISAAFTQGVSGVTHLFNAMSPLVNRQPGAVGAALDNDDCWCGIIVDGHHVAPASLRIALKCKGWNKLMLVTDAMPSVGIEDKHFILQGRPITVSGGICVDANGVLAGSDLDMASAVRNSVTLLGVTLEQAVRMASQVPAEFLRLGDRLGRIAVGYQADLLQATDDLQITASWIKGE